MKVSRLMCLLLLVASLVAIGCGSSSDGDSSASSSGSGAVTTAFLTSGNVQIYHPDGTPWGAIIPNAVKNSVVNVTIPANVTPPFILSVESGTLALGGVGQDKPLASPLKRLVRSTSEYGSLYITAFSTVEAETYLAAYPSSTADALAKEALNAVVDSLGLGLKAVTAMDPRENGDLEYAQQALFLVLGVEDAQGLTNLGERIRQHIADPAAEENVFNASRFAATLDEAPATTISANRETIESNALATFRNGKDAGAPADLTEVNEDIQVADSVVSGGEYTSTPGALVAEEYEFFVQADSVIKGIGIKLNDITGTEIVNAAKNTFTGTATGGIEIAFTSSDPGPDDFATTLEAVSATSGELAFQVPENTATGTYMITLTGVKSPNPVCTISVTVIGEDEVAITKLETLPKYGTPYTTGGYLGFTDNSNKIDSIPSGSQAFFAPLLPRAPKSAPNAVFILSKTGDTAGKVFNVFFEAPEGIKFDLGNNEYSSTLMFAVETTASSFQAAQGYADMLVISSHETNKADITFDDRHELVTTADIPLGQVYFKTRVQDNISKAIVRTASLPIYALNLNSEDYIAEIGELSCDNKTGRIDSGVGHSAGDSEVEYRIDGNRFTAEVKTWEQKAGIRDADLDNPIFFNDAYLFTSSRFEVDSVEQNNLEFSSTTVASGNMTFQIPTDSHTRNLIIRVGNGTDNYERVWMEGWYTKSGEVEATVPSNKGIEFYSDPN